MTSFIKAAAERYSPASAAKRRRRDAEPAARQRAREFFEIPDSEWTRFFEVNVMSGVRLSRAFLPGMVERNCGRIVFLSSESR